MLSVASLCFGCFGGRGWVGGGPRPSGCYTLSYDLLILDINSSREGHSLSKAERSGVTTGNPQNMVYLFYFNLIIFEI